MRLSSILSLFRNEFNKFNNTGVRMLDSICHMPLKYLELHFSCENGKTFPFLRNVIMDVIMFPQNL